LWIITTRKVEIKVKFKVESITIDVTEHILELLKEIPINPNKFHKKEAKMLKSTMRVFMLFGVLIFAGCANAYTYINETPDADQPPLILPLSETPDGKLPPIFPSLSETPDANQPPLFLSLRKTPITNEAPLFPSLSGDVASAFDKMNPEAEPAKIISKRESSEPEGWTISYDPERAKQRKAPSHPDHGQYH